MTTGKDELISQVRALRDDLLVLLDGMDYCLDWKESEDEWSVREVIYHLLDTPAGGVGAVLKQMLEGNDQEIIIRSSLTNMTPERKDKDLADLCRDTEGLLSQVEAGLAAAADADLQNNTSPVHVVSSGTHEDRTPARLVERTLLGHWREHIGQIGEIRQSLGFV